MLVLSCSPGQELIIAGVLHLKVLRVRSHQVKLGFSAPHGSWGEAITVDRAKVHAAKLRDRQAKKDQKNQSGDDHHGR